ncbi:MAG: discoidin domain-containing protein, partial [Clostridia bacterium]|nr:discoidin domain-containing protein [Clostridia bacterium]
LNDLGFVVPTVNGFLLQVDKFITSGGDDVYEPKYSYKGYEYIQIENYSGELDASDVECYLIANDIPDISEFETGDSRINFMHEMMLRTVMNNLQGKLTDTPVYEKNGWTGDVNFALDSFNYNYDFSNVIQKILIDMRDSQNEKGVVAQNVPAAFSGGSNIPVWTSIFINRNNENWHVNGNTIAFAENYDAIRLQTLEYIRAIKANGWVWTTGGYSDWVSPNPSGVLISGHTTHAPEGTGIIGSAFVYRTLGEMAEMADYLGKSEDAEEYRAAMANIYTAFNEKFYLADKGYYDTGFWNETYDAGRSKYRQASNIIPLMFGLCPEEYEASVVKSIVDDIKAKDNHLDVGAVGTKFILPMLSKYGYSDLAMALVQQDTYPSWGYWINLGANTCWETYEYNSRSRNHFFLGTYTDWFYKNLAGVRDFTNGYETVELRPEIHPEIGYVNYSFKTVRGELGSHWRFTEDNKLIWDITVPVGTTATVYLPAKADISEYPCITDNGENLTVPSGNYTFVMDAAEFGVDKSLLKKAVDNAKTFDKTVYTKEDYANFSAVVTECDVVLADANATQIEICKAVDALEIAVKELSFDADRKALSLLVASGESLKAVNYPSDAFEAFLQVLNIAKSVLANTDADKDALNEAYNELYTAMYTVADSCSGNVALGKEVLATSDVVSDYWGKQKITDGNRLNLRGKEVCGWSSSDLTAFNHSETVCVDLGAFYKIDKVNIMPAGAIVGAEALAFPSDFAIYGSLDGESWELLYGEKDYPVPFVELQEFRFEPAKVRYIRFTGTSLRQKTTDGNRFRMQIAEFEAYNTENEVESGNVAYVADGGKGDGRSASSPTSDINVAYALLGESGGTIVFVGEYTTSATVDFPEHTAKVKLTSVHGIDYRLTSDAAIRYAGTGFIKFNGPTEIDGLTVKLDKSSAGFCANFNPVTVGYDFAVVNTDGTTAYRMYFVGGQNGENKGGALAADKTNEIKIYSGKFVMVSAFSRSVALSHSGTVTVTIGGTADVRDLYFGAMGTGAKGGTGIVYLKEKAKVTNAFLSGNTVGMNGSAILRMKDATSVSVFKNSSASYFANGKRELYYTDTVTLPSGFEAH